MKKKHTLPEEVEIVIDPDGTVRFLQLTGEMVEIAGLLDPANNEIKKKIKLLHSEKDRKIPKINPNNGKKTSK